MILCRLGVLGLSVIIIRGFWDLLPWSFRSFGTFCHDHSGGLEHSAMVVQGLWDFLPCSLDYFIKSLWAQRLGVLRVFSRRVPRGGDILGGTNG